MQLFAIDRISQIDSTYTFKATLDPSHKIFEGHFPGNPVTPGVCTLDMVKRCCGVVVGRGVRFDTIKEVKFLSAILPSQHCDLEVVIDVKEIKGDEGDEETAEAKEEISVAVLVKSGDQTMMKLRATLI